MTLKLPKTRSKTSRMFSWLSRLALLRIGVSSRAIWLPLFYESWLPNLKLSSIFERSVWSKKPILTWFLIQFFFLISSSIT